MKEETGVSVLGVYGEFGRDQITKVLKGHQKN